MHIRHCGGDYEKVAEPAGFVDKKKRKPKGQTTGTAASNANPPKRLNKGNTQSGHSTPITNFFEPVDVDGAAGQCLPGVTAPSLSQRSFGAGGSAC